MKDPALLTPLHDGIPADLGVSAHRVDLASSATNEDPQNNTTAPAPCFANDRQLIWFLLSTTAHWIAAGIGLMFAGIIILRFVLLPRIYTCPLGATCPHSFDPRGQILSTIQTVMLYWLRAGCLIAGVGLFKVIAYQGWFMMNDRNPNVTTLELDLAAIHGSASNAASLVWKRRNVSIGLLALSQLAIFTVVPLVINRSISDLKSIGRVRATFSYSEFFTIPSLEAGSPSLAKAVVTVNAWTLGDNQSHPFDDFHGTLVMRDNRILRALDAQPSGSRITGTVACNSTGISSVILPPEPGDTVTAYNVTYGNQWTITDTDGMGSVFLGDVFDPMVSNDNATVSFRLLWSSNTTGQLVNSTVTSDGKVFLTHCIHTIDLSPVNDEHRDHIQPSQFFLPQEQRRGNVPVCTGGHDDICLKVYVGYIILAAWGADGERSSSTPGQIISTFRYCTRGALSALPGKPGETCTVDDMSWSGMLAIGAESVLTASIEEGARDQDLWVVRESISPSQWWLQAIIPAATLIVYVLSVVHIFDLNRKRTRLKELSVSEVVMATIHEQDSKRRSAIDETQLEGLPFTGHAPEPSAYSPSSVKSPVPADSQRLTSEKGTVNSSFDPVLYPNRSLQNRDSPVSVNGTHKRPVLSLLTSTGYSVLSGILFMFSGIVILYFALIPHIYTCPPGATCRHSFDPRGQILLVVQTVMLYWLHIGCFISGVGLVRAIACQGWLIMAKKGSTIGTLELSLAAINGSGLKAALLFLKTPKQLTRVIASFAILYIVIGSVIALVVNRSISGLKATGRARAEFTYPERFTLPGVALPGVVGYGALGQFPQLVLDGYANWLIGDNRTHPQDQFSGTFVVRDNRTVSALDAQPGGSRISGSVSCSPTNISTKALFQTNIISYNITYNDQWVTFNLPEFLRLAFLREPFLQDSADGGPPVVALHLLWATTDAGLITNGSTTVDGMLHVTTCIHTIQLVPIPDQHKDHIAPSILSLSPEARNGSHPMCASGTQDDVCMAMILGDFLFLRWGGYTLQSMPNGEVTSFFKYCRRGAFSYFGDTQDRTCRVDAESWTVTLGAVADGLLRTSKLSGNATQDLWVGTESISKRRWWLQAVIPCAVLVLYVAYIGYVMYLDPRLEDVKELNLTEIVAVATANLEGVRDRVIRGESIELVVVQGTSVSSVDSHKT